MGIGERMKSYEEHFTSLRLIPHLPVCIRLDGRSFHRKTRNSLKPFDENLHSGMVFTALKLAEETDTRVAYTQSDEISLILLEANQHSEPYFGGKVFKIQSVLASLAALTFEERRATRFSYLESDCQFDCRVWNLPSLDEAVNYLIWRELDATRNSVQMAARSRFSHKECLNKSSSELQEMLFAIGINWNNYPAWAKRGSYLVLQDKTVEIESDVWQKIPEKYCPSSRMIQRKSLEPRVFDTPLTSVSNKIEALFEGKVPYYLPQHYVDASF
jgi:tRNA(His) 5'-end guanylyltransferase